MKGELIHVAGTVEDVAAHFSACAEKRRAALQEETGAPGGGEKARRRTW